MLAQALVGVLQLSDLGMCLRLGAMQPRATSVGGGFVVRVTEVNWIALPPGRFTSRQIHRGMGSSIRTVLNHIARRQRTRISAPCQHA